MGVRGVKAERGSTPALLRAEGAVLKQLDAEAESQGGWGCGLKTHGRHGGADAAGVTADILLGPRKPGDEVE